MDCEDFNSMKPEQVSVWLFLSPILRSTVGTEQNYFGKLQGAWLKKGQQKENLVLLCDIWCKLYCDTEEWSLV